MRHIAWIELALCLLTGMALAGQSSAAQAVVRELNVHECHFRMSDPYAGSIDIGSYIATINPKARHSFETWIQFSCQNPVTARTLSELAGLKMTNNGWAFDTSPDSIGLPGQHTTFHPLHGKDWNGGGVTQDDIIGDEDRRTRIFALCIPHDQLALCRVVRYAGYLEHLNESVLPQVIQLLESIEFIDTPTTKPEGASSSSLSAQ
jgi:hypothetical protein